MGTCQTATQTGEGLGDPFRERFPRYRTGGLGEEPAEKSLRDRAQPNTE